MVKKLALGLIGSGLLIVSASATTPGTDTASDAAYAVGWANGTDGGTAATFNPWDLTNNNNNGTTVFAGYFIGDSTSGGGGNINTAGSKAFGMYANPGSAFADAVRSFGASLTSGQTFSFDIAMNFRNGNKGFSLFDGTTEVFNFNVGGDTYRINGNDTGLGYSATSVFHIALTQTGATTGTYSVARDASIFNGSYTGLASGFKFYNSGTDDGGASNNLYFNNLVVSAIPEPSTLSLLAGPAILGALFFVRRRRA